MDKLYGGKNWEKFWVDIERSGNIGIDYCINPVLYPIIFKQLNRNKDNLIIDFGAGTNILAFDLLFGNEKTVPALKLCDDIAHARKNIGKIIGLEQSKHLIDESLKYHKNNRSSEKVGIQEASLHSDNPLLLGDNSVDLAISRNFLMHLSIEDLSYHCSEAARVLKDKGRYVFAILNPDYELKKYSEGNGGKVLKNGESYVFANGSGTDEGSFRHYFKTLEQYEKSFENEFRIIDKKRCFPISDAFKDSYSRYYEKECPMALVYELEKLI